MLVDFNWNHKLQGSSIVTRHRRPLTHRLTRNFNGADLWLHHLRLDAGKKSCLSLHLEVRSGRARRNSRHGY